jgi:hypothetical protein
MAKQHKVKAVVRQEFPNNPPPHTYKIHFNVWRTKLGGWSGSHGWQSGLKEDQLEASLAGLKQHLERDAGPINFDVQYEEQDATSGKWAVY